MGARRLGDGEQPHPGRHMEERAAMQMHRALIQADMGDEIDGVRHDVAMAEQHALGRAGGAAGIKQAGAVIIAASEIRHRGSSRQRVLIAQHAIRRRAGAHQNDMLHAGGCTQCRDMRKKIGIDHQYAGLGIRQLRHRLGHGKPVVERHHDPAGPDRREIDLI